MESIVSISIKYPYCILSPNTKVFLPSIHQTDEMPKTSLFFQHQNYQNQLLYPLSSPHLTTVTNLNTTLKPPSPTATAYGSKPLKEKKKIKAQYLDHCNLPHSIMWLSPITKSPQVQVLNIIKIHFNLKMDDCGILDNGSHMTLT